MLKNLKRGWNKMKFEKAVKAMKEGKKVRRTCQIRGFYVDLEGDNFVHHNYRDKPKFDLRDIEATDWQIVEEKKKESWEETSTKQVSRLAEFIMTNINGEPCKSEGAVDTAIRLLTTLPQYNKKEDKNTLSDKIKYAFMLQSSNDLILMANPTEEMKKKYIEEGCIPVIDIEEAIKELQTKVQNKDFPTKDHPNFIFYRDLLREMNKIFGKGLI